MFAYVTRACSCCSSDCCWHMLMPGTVTATLFCNNWLNMYAKCDLHITLATRTGGKVGPALVCLLAGLRYAIFAQHWLPEDDYALCVPHSGMYECALATPPPPSPPPSCLVICQLCDRQTKHSADCACFIVMTPASVRPSRTCDSIYMRISRTCDLSSGH